MSGDPTIEDLLNPEEENAVTEEPTDDGFSSVCKASDDEDEITLVEALPVEMTAAEINVHLQYISKFIVRCDETGLPVGAWRGLRILQRG